VDPILVIVNADASTADDALLASALDVLRTEASVELASTSSSGELDGVLHRAGSRRLVVAGGDGSMHAVVAALHRRYELKTKVLGLLPMGADHDFARGNGIPLDINQAAHLVLNGTPRPVGILLDEVGQVVVNNVHVGAGSIASREGSAWTHRLGKLGTGRVNLGRLGYPVGALLAAVRPGAVRLRVEVDGRVVNDWNRPVSMVALGHRPGRNRSPVDHGVGLNPDADPENGQIDVIVSRAVGPLARFRYAASLASGRRPERADVARFHGSQVTISGQEFWCSADGASYGPERRRSWHVEPAAYSLLVP
jgi:diacylglycerol kinase (ATP)